MNKNLTKLKEFIVPEGSEIQVAAFNILAVCGMTVSAVVALYNLLFGFRLQPFFECLSGVFISLALIIYTRKTGNYKRAMVLTVLIIFIGLFTVIYLASGGFYAGVPFFFVFAVVFTAFLLNGVTMAVLVIFELAWYAALSLHTYYNPMSVKMNASKEVFIMDAIVCETIVSISLAVTMYFQIRVYRKNQLKLNEAILAAEEANKAKSDFLAKMSHDIRTPLNTMMAMNEMIVTNTSSAKIREWVNDSNVSGKILLSLIDDMLDLTKIEVGKMNLLDQPINVRHLFDEIVMMWQPHADKAGLDFDHKIDDSVPGYLLGDADLIRKIINNLLSNAIKYTKKGKVSLNVGWKGDLIIEVGDTGVGIAPEFVEKIFKPFERGVQEIYKETSGSGLGLAIVKELVDAMEGSVKCESVIDEGTVFTVNLPLKVYYDKEEIIEKEAKEAETSGKKRLKDQFIAPDARILVVDDNQFNRKVIRLFLEPSLIHIDDVESGFEAIEMIDIREYDLILMDLRMPNMDGAETLEKIKAEYPDFKTPVIVLTADIMDGVKERLLSQGFAEFLPKPVNAGDLLDTIVRFIPDKVVTIKTEQEDGLTLARIESYRKKFMPYGIDLNYAMENNAGNAEEFMTRVKLFDEYADDNITRLNRSGYDEDYYLQIHAVKSIARGIGAHLLAQMTESVEIRHDDDFSKEINPIILDEYARVREGLRRLTEAVEKGHE